MVNLLKVASIIVFVATIIFGFPLLFARDRQYEARVASAVVFLERLMETGYTDATEIELLASHLAPNDRSGSWKLRGIVEIKDVLSDALYKKYEANLESTCLDPATDGCWKLEDLILFDKSQSDGTLTSGQDLVEVLPQLQRLLPETRGLTLPEEPNTVSLTSASPVAPPFSDAPPVSDAAAQDSRAIIGGNRAYSEDNGSRSGKQNALGELSQSRQPVSSELAASSLPGEFSEENVSVGSEVEDQPDSELIEKIQTLLRNIGYEPGPADGKLGPRTTSAIMDYQLQSALPPDGQPSDFLLKHLQELQNQSDHGSSLN